MIITKIITTFDVRFIIVVGTYSPISEGMVFPSVRAIGREGLWHISQADCRASKDVVDRGLAEEGCILQAEEEGFFFGGIGNW